MSGGPSDVVLTTTLSERCLKALESSVYQNAFDEDANQNRGYFTIVPSACGPQANYQDIKTDLSS